MKTLILSRSGWDIRRNEKLYSTAFLYLLAGGLYFALSRWFSVLLTHKRTIKKDLKTNTSQLFKVKDYKRILHREDPDTQSQRMGHLP